MKFGLSHERKNVNRKCRKILHIRIFGPEREEVMRDWRK
jgi:hypothetical protein